MNDRDIDNLIRMAVEVEEIERLSSTATQKSSAGTAPGDLTHEAGAAPRTIHFPRLRIRGTHWWIGLSAAAAACLLFILWPRSHPPTPPAGELLTVAEASKEIPVEIDYCPALPRRDGVRIDRFEPSSPENCSVLAIFHTWHEECKCLAWELYEWEDGRPLAEFSPDRVLDIALDVTNAPPLEQLLVVAIARDPNDLPRSETDTCELLHCLNEVRPPTDPGDTAAAYASAVRACLPKGVTVVPQAFFVE